MNPSTPWKVLEYPLGSMYRVGFGLKIGSYRIYKQESYYTDLSVHIISWVENLFIQSWLTSTKRAMYNISWQIFSIIKKVFYTSVSFLIHTLNVQLMFEQRRRCCFSRFLGRQTESFSLERIRRFTLYVVLVLPSKCTVVSVSISSIGNLLPSHPLL